MNSEFGMYQGYNVESKNIEMSNQKTFETSSMGDCQMNQGIVCPPVYECPRERCVHRHFCHEVPHDCQL